MSEFHIVSRLQRHDLHKLHGLGNDFLVWFQPSVPENAAELARRWCRRTTGIGADGLVIAIDNRIAPKFVLFNADGSRAEVSGNGLRCFGHVIAARRGVDSLVTLAETDTGDRALSVRGALTDTTTVSVGMGVPKPGPSLIELNLDGIVSFRQVDAIDVGNPHLVIEVDDLDGYDMAMVGPAIEAQFLPIGINVHLVKPTDAGVEMLIWERGAGVTAACGSGACAAVAVAAVRRPEQTSFEVRMPGGTATVEVGDELTLVGPSVYVAAIEPRAWA